jgi:PIN domain nuclease of toxin-antitoxin system
MERNAVKATLLDTQAFVWLSAGAAKLGRHSRATIDAAMHANLLYISAISFWEIAMLLSRNRLQFPQAADIWRRDALQAGIAEISISGDIGVAAVLLPNFHPDPADRIIVATALRENALLITADQAILAWPGTLDRHDARL